MRALRTRLPDYRGPSFSKLAGSGGPMSLQPQELIGLPRQNVTGWLLLARPRRELSQRALNTKLPA